MKLALAPSSSPILRVLTGTAGCRVCGAPSSRRSARSKTEVGGLHDLVASGRPRGFVMPYLGQQDRSLPASPPDLVSCEVVADYPTNFAAPGRSDARDAQRLRRTAHACPPRRLPARSVVRRSARTRQLSLRAVTATAAKPEFRSLDVCQLRRPWQSRAVQALALSTRRSTASHDAAMPRPRPCVTK